MISGLSDLTEPFEGRIDWFEDHGCIVLMGVQSEAGEEITIPWDHRSLHHFLDAFPQPIGMLVECTDEGVFIVE